MKPNGAYALVFLGLASLNEVKASQVLTRINPELDPTSDKKFFGKDYPDDHRPPVYAHEKKIFSHPYPTVQDSDRYDKDYVKDENDDGGYWKAQMEYDALKNKLAKEKKEMAKALAKEHEEEKEFGAAQAAEEAAEKKAEAAEKKEEAAENERQDADAKHDKIQDYLDEATDEVEKEVKDLEDCKKQLQEAKAKLKALLAEKDAADKKKGDSDAAETAAEEKEKAAEKTAAEFLKEYNKEKDEQAAALHDVEKEKADVKRAEENLAKQAENLRKYRHADPDGGVYEVKSGGALYGSSLAALLLVAMGNLL